LFSYPKQHSLHFFSETSTRCNVLLQLEVFGRPAQNGHKAKRHLGALFCGGRIAAARFAVCINMAFRDCWRSIGLHFPIPVYGLNALFGLTN
jgi:hypothetical protein